MLHGVHIHKSVEPSLAVRCAAAGLVLPTGAVFSDLTALELLGLPLPFGAPRDRPLDVTVVPPLDRPQGSGIRGHRRGLRADEVTVTSGVRVTVASRTFTDLAATLDTANLIVIGDAILREPRASLAELEIAIRAASG